MSRLFHAVRVKLFAVAAVVVAASGCGQSYTDVTGKVSYRDRPVVYGTVSIIGPDQMTYYGTIQLDGTFTVPKVPVGPVKLGVYSPDPYFEPPVPPAVKARIEEARRASGEKERPKPPKGQWVRLPPKYADPLSSGLVADVGSQPEPIHLRLD
jgi:hypothetical protein